MKRIGVLLAAGQSKRMGRLKQLLPWPPKCENAKPLVAAAFDAIARACDEMVVVVGHHADDVIAALGARRFHFVNGESEKELFVSIRRGLLGASQIDPTADVLLQPADHPQVRLDTLQTLIERLAENAGLAVMPAYRGKGGHPVCMPMSIVNEVLGYAGRGGLRQFWVDHPELCVRLPVDDPGVVFDVDTQLDYDLGVQ